MLEQIRTHFVGRSGRRLVAGLAALAVATSLAGYETAAAGQGGARVSITASAIDATGRPVGDLTAADLEVRLGSGAATVSKVAHLGPPKQIVVLLDMSATAARNPQKMLWNAQCVVSLAEHLAGARTFLVLGFSDKIAELYNGPANPQAIKAALEKTPRQGNAALFEVLKFMGQQIAQQNAGDRTVFVVVSDGVDNASRASAKDVIQTLGVAGVPLYSCIVMDPAWNLQNLSKLNAKANLQDISKATGGSIQIMTPGETSSATAKIASMLAGRYRIDIDPSVPLEAKSETTLLLGANRQGVEVYCADRVYPK